MCLIELDIAYFIYWRKMMPTNIEIRKINLKLFLHDNKKKNGNNFY